jgi:hypothetical protein
MVGGLEQRARAGRRFQTSIRIALPPAALPPFFNPFPTLPRSVPGSYYALSTPPAWTHPESCFVGLIAAKTYGGTAGLKLESSTPHFGVDALECLRRRSFALTWLGWLRSKHNHQLCSCLAVAPSRPSRQCLVSDYNSVGLPWQSLHALRPGKPQKCLTATWLTSAWLCRR